jgi:hypothetical protein
VADGGNAGRGVVVRSKACAVPPRPRQGDGNASPMDPLIRLSKCRRHVGDDVAACRRQCRRRRGDDGAATDHAGPFGSDCVSDKPLVVITMTTACQVGQSPPLDPPAAPAACRRTAAITGTMPLIGA